VTDPTGDARQTSTNPPDLASATIDVAGAVVTVTIGYVPGTVSQSDVYIDQLARLPARSNPRST
jgi:hypothetical protein